MEKLTNMAESVESDWLYDFRRADETAHLLAGGTHEYLQTV